MPLAEQFFNRHKSWLEFNSRVLHQALDRRTPLAERLRFCHIVRSNNDEFFQKNAAPLYSIEEDEQDQFLPYSDITVKGLLEYISQKVRQQVTELSSVFEKEILPGLEKEGIKLFSWDEIEEDEREELVSYFQRFVFPILTPLAVDAGHPFPFLSNLSKSIGIWMRTPDSNNKLFARVNVPEEIPQWIPLKKNDSYQLRYINIEEVIDSNLDLLFSGMKIEASMIFRITRHSFDRKHTDELEDLKLTVEKKIQERKFAPIIRVEHEKNSDFWILNFLQDELSLSDLQLFEMPSLICYSPLLNIVDNITNAKLKYKPFTPRTDSDFSNLSSNSNIFKFLKRKDYLFHFPYDSFSSTVETFLNSAADDPLVKAIKITLYRTDSKGRIIQALIRAAENKKQVVCIIELEARFDEEANIYWAEKLAKAGVYIIYGFQHQKTHAKMIAVARVEKDGINTYVNITTGNYNPQTSKVYTDISYFTCKKDIGEEVLEIFNFLTGRSFKHNYRYLLVAPITMYPRSVEIIEEEIDFHQKGGKGQIILKMNSLEDPSIIQSLYKASKAGVEIILIVRGICTLRPQVEGLSENIRVYSIVGRFLEHSRIFYFRSGQNGEEDGRFFIGSADWKNKSLFKRVEVMVPIMPKNLKNQLWQYLNLCINDNRNLWELESDGSYTQRKMGKKEINSQRILQSV